VFAEVHGWATANDNNGNGGGITFNYSNDDDDDDDNDSGDGNGRSGGGGGGGGAVRSVLRRVVAGAAATLLSSVLEIDSFDTHGVTQLLADASFLRTTLRRYCGAKAHAALDAVDAALLRHLDDDGGGGGGGGKRAEAVAAAAAAAATAEVRTRVMFACFRADE
jgi:hypothetical protein